MNCEYNFSWFDKNILNETDAVRLFQKYKIIPDFKLCHDNHSMLFTVTNENRHCFWQCKKNTCNLHISVRKDTWLEGSKISLMTILKFIYSWTRELASVEFSKKELRISSKSTVKFNNCLREVCATTLLKQPRSLGGEDKIVEIDETYFSKRRNEEGKMVPDQWVFGGICRETEEVFLCPVPEITEEAIIECIKNNIKPGTTIISDCQPSYKNIGYIEDYHYKHIMINNNEDDVDPTINANIQSIENIWFILNERNKKHCGTVRQMFNSYLSEFVWRRRYANKDLFVNILKDIASCYPPKVSKHPPKILPSPQVSKPTINSGKEKRKRVSSKESLNLKESGKKLRRVKTRENLEVDIVESDFPPDPLQTLNDDKNDNNCKELLTKPDSLESQVNSLGNILVQTVHNPLHSSSNFSGSHDDLMGKEGLETEFDLFAKSVGKQLNSMPPKDALQLQLKIQEVINNFTQQMSFITPNKPSTDVPPLCDENFIDIKMEITDDFF
ncbi:UNVERIFIED_CONTAM: hypothetical protein RMT77_003575 [Armadillidium vulgare]